MKRRFIAALGITALMAAGCGREGPAERPDAPSLGSNHTLDRPDAVVKAAALERFEDCAEVTDSLRGRALAYVGANGLPGAGGGLTVVAVPLSGASADARMAQTEAAAAPPAGTDFSDTNVQEAGVDEPDTVETDGRRIFAVAGQRLHAAAVDDEPRLVGSLELTGYGHQLLLAGDRLVVLGPDEVVGRPEPLPGPAADLAIAPVMPEQTLVQVVDVSDASRMRVLSTLHLDGGYVSARAVDGIARVVVRRSQPRIGFVYPQDGTPGAQERALERNRDAVRRATVDQWIPRYELDARGGRSSGRLSSCESTYRPPDFSGFGTVTVVTIDPADPTPREGSTVVGGGDIVYASRDALYVTTQRWAEPRPLTVEPRPLMGAEPAVAPDMIVDPDSTQIHKFDIRGRQADYMASGLVEGSLLSQWSMSEHDGHLRVASTAGPTFAPTEEGSSESFVSVLAQRGAALVRVGRVGGLGRGERIYAVRFIGDVGYVVTFRQVDPLYTLDLSDPAQPKVVGELKIPGYSAYLHPVGDGLLLGIGQDASTDGRVLGTQVSLFEVRDPAAPKRLAQLKLGGGNSQAEYDHHAFLWWAQRRLAVLPVQLYAIEPDARGEVFSGAVGLRVDGGIEEIGRVSHPAVSQPDIPETYAAPINRSLVAANALFTVSDAGIMASDLASFDRRAWLPFS